MHNALHPRDDVNGLYVPRKEGTGGLACIEDSVDASIKRLEHYIEKCEGRLITATGNNSQNTRINRTTITRKPKWDAKNSIDVFKRLTRNITYKKTVVLWPLTRPKMPLQGDAPMEVTHSNGSYGRKSRGRKLADEMGRGKKIPMILS